MIGAGASALKLQRLIAPLCRVTRMHWRSCSSSEKSVQSVRMVCASIRFKSSTLPESCASRLLIADDLQILALLLWVTSSSSSRSAKPLMLTMGVLNSWESYLKILAQQLRAGKLLRRFVEGCFELPDPVGSYRGRLQAHGEVPAASRFIACMMF